MEATVRVNATQKTQESNTPAKRIRAGPVSATIWENESVRDDSMPAKYYTVTLDRSYKDKEGEWHHTQTLRMNDVPKATLVLQKAYEWIALNEA